MTALDISDLAVNAPDFPCMIPLDRADVMYPDRGGYDYAKQFCRACPFVERCRDRNDKIEPNKLSTMHGIVAGETPEERFNRRIPHSDVSGVIEHCKNCGADLYAPKAHGRAHRGRTYWKDDMCRSCWNSVHAEEKKHCASCGRLVYKRNLPKEKRPKGAIAVQSSGMCSKCLKARRK